MTQQLGALAALAEDPDLVPSICMRAHNSITPIPRDLTNALFWP